MKELVEFIARELVNNPNAVEVQEFDEDQTAVFELRVAEEDLGRVIGRDGRTAKAIRTLLSAAATGSGRRAVLEIRD